MPIDKLEDFILNNRESFDDETTPNDLWDRIESAIGSSDDDNDFAHFANIFSSSDDNSVFARFANIFSSRHCQAHDGLLPNVSHRLDDALIGPGFVVSSS